MTSRFTAPPQGFGVTAKKSRFTAPPSMEESPEQSQEETGWYGVGKDILHKTSDYLKDAGLYSAQHVKGLGKGLLDIGASVGNVQPWYHIPKASEEYPPTSPAEAGGLALAKGLAPAALEATAAGKVARIIPKAAEGASLISRLLRGTGKIGLGTGTAAGVGAATNEENRSQGAKTGAAAGAAGVALPMVADRFLTKYGSRGVTAADEAFQKAMADFQAKEHALAQSEGKYGEKYHITDPYRYGTRVEEHGDKIRGLEAQNEQLPNEPFSETVLHPAHTQLVPRAEQQANNINETISRYLDKGEPNDVKLANIATHGLEAHKAKLGEEYTSIGESLKGKPITVKDIEPNDIYNQAEIEFNKQFPNASDEFRSRNMGKYIDEAARNAEKETQETTIDAQKYFNKYRSLVQQAEEATTNAYSHKQRLTQEQRDAYKDRAKFLKEQAAYIENQMRDQIGKDAFSRLQKINKRYATEYGPLNENALYQQMLEGQKIDVKDIPHALRGIEPGNDILSKFIKESPEASYYLASHQFAENPSALQNINKLTQKFINEKTTPGLHKLIQEQGKSLEEIERAKIEQKHWEETHKQISKALQEHETGMKQRATNQVEIDRLKAEIPDLKKAETVLRHQTEQKDISKSEHDKRTAALSKAIADKERNQKRLKKVLKYGAIGVAEEIYRRNK